MQCFAWIVKPLVQQVFFKRHFCLTPLEVLSQYSTSFTIGRTSSISIAKKEFVLQNIRVESSC